MGIFSKPPLDTWVGAEGRVMLLGDAAHPPVPYIGQGAMMAMEDVGVLVRCLKHYCCKSGSFDDSTANLQAAAAVYQVRPFINLYFCSSNLSRLAFCSRSIHPSIHPFLP